MTSAQQKVGGLEVEVAGPDVLARSTGTVEAEVDGERVLLSPKDFSYFGLAGAGAPVWDLIDGEASVDAIVAALEAEFMAEPGVIRHETLEFVDALLAAGLIEVVGQ